MISTRAAVVSISLALLGLTASAAQAQLGLGAPLCQSRLGVDEPRYLGKQSGQDAVEVSWSGPAPAANGGFQVGIGIDRVAACAVQQGLTARYQVALTVERRLGHRDSGSATVNGSIGGVHQRNIQVPRANLETDPQKYDVTIDGTVQGALTTFARASGAGAPALAGANLSSGTSVSQLSAQCAPTFAVTALALASPNSVSVSWSPPPLASQCLKSNGTGVQVTLKRPDGSSLVRSTNAPPGAISAVVSLGEVAGEVASFEVTLTVLATSTLVLHGSAEGRF